MDKKKYILAVDDTPANLKLLGHILKDDYMLNFAVNGKKALELVNKKSPDLILLDIMMPEMDGFEVCKKIKSNKDLKDIPIIFLTAKSDRSSVVQGLSLGASDYLIKPFEKEDVLIRIAKIIQDSSNDDTDLDPETSSDIDKKINTKQTSLFSSSIFTDNRIFNYEVCMNDFKNQCLSEMTRLDQEDETIFDSVYLYLDYIKKFEELLNSKKLKIDREYKGDISIEKKLKTIQSIRTNKNMVDSLLTINKRIDRSQHRREAIRQKFVLSEITYEVAPFELDKWIVEFIELLPVQITVEKNIPEGVEISGNSELLNQILISVLDNSIDKIGNEFSSEDIKLEFALRDKFLIISVVDTGKTATEELKDLIFKEGYSTKQNRKGMGLSAAKIILKNFFSSSIYVLTDAKNYKIQIKIPCKLLIK